VIHVVGYIELPIAIGDALKAAAVAPEQRVQLTRKGFKRTCFGKGVTCADRLRLRYLFPCKVPPRQRYPVTRVVDHYKIKLPSRAFVIERMLTRSSVLIIV